MDKRRFSVMAKSGCAVLLLGLSISGEAGYYGQPERAGRWEAALGARYQDFGTFDFKGPSKLDVGDSTTVNFSFAYNFDNHWSLGFEFSGDDVDYDATVNTNSTPSEQVALSGELDTSTGQLLGTWHMFEGALTPYATIGLGWTYIDSNIISNYEGSGCWWNPWYWGYTCGSFYDTYDETAFSYSAVLGLRWDITPVVFMRGSVGKQWLDLDNGSNDTDMARVEVGMMF